ncbi:MAG: alkene reductase [Pseudobdellovibrio sp.]
MSTDLFSKVKLGNTELQNRIAMAPMTRSRAIGNVVSDLVVQYYKQRSSAGLIITEGVSPSPNGLGYARIPGLFNQYQADAWKPVTKAVHEGGAKIYVQLMHTGRVSHSNNMPAGSKIQAPSAIAAPGEMWTDQQGQQSFPIPAEMTEAEIQTAVLEYATSAKLAIAAGFDGVELHGANGYLIDQFLNTASNKRTDKWGGSIENRIRFAVEVAKATAAAIGPDKLGIRVSPYGAFNGMQADEKTEELYATLAKELNALNLAYIHVVDHSAMGAPPVSPTVKAKIRDIFKGKYILSGGYTTAEAANKDLEAHKGDLVAFGRPFISNPDLVEKLKTGKPLTPPDYNTFYTPGEKGYTDY